MSDSNPRASARDLNLHLGRRVRARRREAGLSLEAVASHLGLTYQQVQKYERGSNRISAATLYEIAQVLGVPVADFFDSLPRDPSSPSYRDQARLDELLGARGGGELLDAFLALSQQHRRALIDLAIAAAGLKAPSGEGAEEASRVVRWPIVR